MMYRELVHRVLAVKHANIEMGLAKSREQQVFIEAVARKLDATSWDYTVRMDGDFAVTFNLDLGLVSFENQYEAVKQALLELFDVSDKSPELLVYCRHTDYSCRVIFGDMP